MFQGLPLPFGIDCQAPEIQPYAKPVARRPERVGIRPGRVGVVSVPLGCLFDETKHHVVYCGGQGQEGVAVSWVIRPFLLFLFFFLSFSSPPFCSDAQSLELEPDQSLLT